LRKGFIYISLLFCVLVVMIISAACGGSSGGGISAEDATTIQGTVSSASTKSQVLRESGQGLSGVTVSALGASGKSDENGNFSLTVDGSLFAGGAVEFTLSGGGVEGTILFSNVAGGPGVTAFVDLVVKSDGSISGTSKDESGKTLSSVGTLGDFSCTKMLSFSDGAGNNLWKPIAESTGTVVILMPAEYRHAEFSIVDASGESAASIIKRDCCDHNGGRDHIFLDQSAASLAGKSLPLTVIYKFSADNVHCLTVANPQQRYD
jgi:hypothetical protein